MSDVERIAQIQADTRFAMRGEHGWHSIRTDDLLWLLAALARRDAAIQAVQALHYEYMDSFTHLAPASPQCHECCEPFPCATVAAIAAEMENEQ